MQSAEVEAQIGHTGRRNAVTSAEMTKLSRFDGTTSWILFHCQRRLRNTTGSTRLPAGAGRQPTLYAESLQEQCTKTPLRWSTAVTRRTINLDIESGQQCDMYLLLSYLSQFYYGLWNCSQGMVKQWNTILNIYEIFCPEVAGSRLPRNYNNHVCDWTVS
jgi:hypothetical protein